LSLPPIIHRRGETRDPGFSARRGAAGV